jgi:hypothetical protein
VCVCVCVCLLSTDHCKLHGADVTTRLMTMLSKAGLANLSAAPASKQAQSVGLVSMVAAMIHDYSAPRIRSPFHRVCQSAYYNMKLLEPRCLTHRTSRFPCVDHPQVNNAFLVEKVRFSPVESRPFQSCIMVLCPFMLSTIYIFVNCICKVLTRTISAYGGGGAACLTSGSKGRQFTMTATQHLVYLQLASNVPSFLYL